jgi:hypothetical protein
MTDSAGKLKPPLTCNPPFPPDPPGSQASAACYVAPTRYQDYEPFGPNIHGGLVAWNLPEKGATLIYKMPEKDFVKAFRYDATTLSVSETPTITGTIRPPDGMPGGFGSISANGSGDGILWISFPEGDATTQTVPGRLVAFDALTLAPLWEDEDPIAFSKFTPPTIADGKVYRPTFANSLVVYGLLPPSIGPTAAICRTITQTYNKYGAERGILGTPVGDEIAIGDPVTGTYRQYHGKIFGGLVSSSLATAYSSREPEGRNMSAFESRSEVLASIYWSPQTCAHVVMGGILEYWMSLGGEKSELGYPTSDETNTPDNRGRRSRFERGEIWWYPDRGAFIHSRAAR